MQNSHYDTSSSRLEQESLIDQLAAVLCPPAADRHESGPFCTDIGNILLQLSEAVAEAKTEADQERRRRIELEAENASFRAKNVFTHSSESSLVADNCVYYDSSLSTPLVTPSLESSMIESSASLSQCLEIVSALPQPELVYISYFLAGIEELDWSMVAAIYKPCDFSSLAFVVFNSFQAVVPSEMIPFTLDGLQSLLASNTQAPMVSPVSQAEESADEPPRMNLLEALNVQSDNDCCRIVTVRKCHKLGFKSHIHLRQYFSRFGRVDRVVLLPMRAKPKNATDGRGNRPSSMGFVVMESKEGADRILSCNNYSGIHEIKGWPIEVRNFVKPADKPLDRDVSGASTGIASEFAW